MHYRQLTNLLWGWLLTFWATAAWAAQSSFGTDMASIPPSAIAISALLAIIGGAAYSAQKVANPDTVIKSILLEVIKDILTSIVIGLLVFFLGSWLQWASVVQAGLITLGGYGGSRVLEPALQSFISWISRLGAKQ